MELTKVNCILLEAPGQVPRVQACAQGVKRQGADGLPVCLVMQQE